MECGRGRGCREARSSQCSPTRSQLKPVTDSSDQHVACRAHGTHPPPPSTSPGRTRVVQVDRVRHPHCTGCDRCHLPGLVPPAALHPHLPGGGGRLRAHAEPAVLPALRQAVRGRPAGHATQPRLHHLELPHLPLPLLLVHRRKRVDLLHLRAQLQPEQYGRGPVLRQDAVSVCVLDHHAGVHPAGAVHVRRLLCAAVLLYVRPGRPRRRVNARQKVHWPVGLNNLNHVIEI